jgi:outer membrane protein
LKNLSLILNLVLFVLVAVLFYFHFKGPSAGAPIVINPTSKDSNFLKPLKVAYVDLDSITEKFTYFKQKQTESERREEQTDQQLNSAYANLQRDRDQFVQRGSAITQIESDNFQKEYASRLQDLQRQKEGAQQAVISENQKIMEDVQGKINTFMAEYNKSKKYSFIFGYSKGSLALFYKDTAYNITNEVLDGLNATFKAPESK